ncbi:MAG: hypothetical protein MI745_10600 [Pseudomonadales bacterium]|nr:hypothetical protein [Pseudomonadales bacterium]
MTASDTLPIDSLRDDFLHHLARGPVVVSAATGSGKSTRLPVWASERGPVLVVEPRRVACTALAGFVAGQRNEKPGHTVGYAIRFDQACSDATDIVFVTPGIALRWLREGRLARFHTVMLDEFHERRWDTDLLLALLKMQNRHRLIVTSATLDGPRLAHYLQAPQVASDGRGFPVTAHYHAANDRQMPSARDLPQRVLTAVKQGMAEDDGDVLVFLPGRKEIQQTVATLQPLAAEVIALHASVPAKDQQRALQPGARRRIIVATNVAETSLTIPGVTLVVDGGLERRTHQRNGRTVLSLEAISQASADQRKGRAGRTAPGRVIRLWGENAPLEARTPPEIQREELDELVLAAACAGARVDDLDFPAPLPAHTLQRAREQLAALGALGKDGLATERGQALFALPVDTFFAHLIMAMPDADSQGFMVDLAAALSAWRRPLSLPRSEEGRQALVAWQPHPCDATTLVQAIRQRPPEALKPNHAARDEARQLAGQMRKALGLPAIPDTPPGDLEPVWQAAMQASPRAVFVRREKQTRRDAMGNGSDEVWVSEESRFDDTAEAALVLDSHSVPGRGTRQTFTAATCLAPLSLRALVDGGLAEPRVGPLQQADDEPVATREWLYAGRVIHTETAEPEGDAARQVLADLILDGDFLAPAGEQLRDDLEAWQLYVALGEADGEVPQARPWLLEKLAVLGVERLDDRELLAADDLRFDGIPDWERERFEEKFPRRVNLSDLKLRIHYKVQIRQVIAEYISGGRKGDPKRWELPAWSGWQVKYRKASRLVDVR